MRGFVRNLVITVLVLGIALGLWRLIGGDVGGFFNTVGTVIYTVIEAVGNFFFHLFQMFTGSK